jgi:hypothetical protein
MEDAEFRSGAIDIQWLERRLDSLLHVKPPAETTRTAALIAALIADRDRRAPQRASAAVALPASTSNAWTQAGRAEGLR